MAHTFCHIFCIYCFNYFIRNPQTTNSLTFLTHTISGIGGVDEYKITITICQQKVYKVSKKIYSNSYFLSKIDDSKFSKIFKAKSKTFTIQPRDMYK